MTEKELQTIGAVIAAFQQLRQAVRLECTDPDERDGTIANIDAVQADIVDIMQGKIFVSSYLVFRFDE